MKPSSRKFVVSIPSTTSSDKPEEIVPLKRTSRKKNIDVNILPEDATKNVIVQSISSVLENKGISNEAGKHQDVISISEGYKKKIYISRPASKSNTHCYFCRQSFEDHPIGHPIKIGKKKYIVEGVFCSFNCIMAFQQEQNSVRYRESSIHFHTLYRELFGKRVDILPSKSWKLLQDYGGELNIQQWRNLVSPFVTLPADLVPLYKSMITESSEMFIGD
jgi:hypothetical protein